MTRASGSSSVRRLLLPAFLVVSIAFPPLGTRADDPTDPAGSSRLAGPSGPQAKP